MAGIEIENEPWLLKQIDHPESYLQQLTASRNNLTAFSRTLNAHLAHRLDFTQMQELDAFLQSSGVPLQDLPGIQNARLGILSNTTQAFSLAPLRIAALRRGINLTLTEMTFDQAASEPTGSADTSPLAECDYLLIAPDRRQLPYWPAAGTEGSIDNTFCFLTRLYEQQKKKTAAQIIIQNLPQEPGAYYGSFDVVSDRSPRARIDQFNQKLTDYVRQNGAILFDVAALAEQIGLMRWQDPVYWLTSRIAVSPDLMPVWADHLARLMAASAGLSRRGLILDLDNTLWGGVLSDDGPDGLMMAHGDAVGEAFRGVQQMARGLAARGILLAIASKNDPDAVRSIFRTHPDMILREEDIAVFSVGQTDKAILIGDIVEKLGWAASYFVFLDDTPAERKRIREAFPDMAVPELPDDPAQYPWILSSAGYFETTMASAEDGARTRLYQEKIRSAAAATAPAVDYHAYLKSLKMTLRAGPFDATAYPRIVQLIHKSNQFNLTTKRYSATDIRRMEAQPDIVTLQLRLTDIFGDNGIIGLLICRESDGGWDIDSWIMSCRVLHRRIEEATLCALITLAHARGIHTLTGTYLPTDRNRLVSDLYKKLGFQPQPADDLPDGATRWGLTLTSAPPVSLPEIRTDMTALGLEPWPQSTQMQ